MDQCQLEPASCLLGDRHTVKTRSSVVQLSPRRHLQCESRALDGSDVGGYGSDIRESWMDWIDNFPVAVVVGSKALDPETLYCLESDWIHL